MQRDCIFVLRYGGHQDNILVVRRDTLITHELLADVLLQQQRGAAISDIAMGLQLIHARAHEHVDQEVKPLSRDKLLAVNCTRRTSR